MENNTTNDFLVGGKTMAQWEEEMNNSSYSGSMSYQDAEKLGMLSPEQQFTQQGNNQFATIISTINIIFFT